MKYKIFMAALIILLGTVAGIYATATAHFLLSHAIDRPQIIPFAEAVGSILSGGKHMKLFLGYEGLLILITALIIFQSGKSYKSSTVKITPDIEIPVPAGQNQCGSARFLPKDKYREAFGVCKIDEKPKDGGGLVVNLTGGKKDEVHYLKDDSHTLIIGKTGSGKTRRLILESIAFLAQAGNSMVLSDPKGELHAFTREYLKEMEYEVLAILATLNLFTTQDIYAITHSSDFALDEVGKKKQALFIILPDQRPLRSGYWGWTPCAHLSSGHFQVPI
jgi:type IV secretion system protein VirD4